ncbi:MAG: Permease YjgP/YjgQ family protein [Pedosphaera sp.]|nr:Permease YjgP/YjgQ family protein [Pedosphaera sp.]
MRLLDRYLLRELLIPLGFLLCGFLIVLIAFQLFSDLSMLQTHQMTVMDVVQYYLVSTPEFLVLLLPVVLLLGLLYTLTNHARHNEITAIRAAGVSLWRLCIPYFVVGLFFGVVLFAMNELWVPDSSEMAAQILNRHAEKAPGALDKDTQINFGFRNGRDRRTWLMKSYNLKTHVMTLPKVNWELTGTNYLLIADSADYADGVWTFHNAQKHHSDTGVLLVQTNLLVMPEFTETPGQIKREFDFNKRFTVRAALSPDIPIREIIGYLRLHPNDLTAQKRNQLDTQLHSRLALPWTCLVVVMIAIPFGAASGRRNVFVGVASSIVICFAYFILSRLGIAMGTGGWIPSWVAAWLPNLAFGLTGAWMMLRVR